jgi:hypothetical protein
MPIGQVAPGRLVAPEDREPCGIERKARFTTTSSGEVARAGCRLLEIGASRSV